MGELVRRRLAAWEDPTDRERLKAALPWSVGLHVLVIAGGLLGSWIVARMTPPPPVFEVELAAPIKKGTGGGVFKNLPSLSSPKPAPHESVTIPDPRLLEAERNQALLDVEREQALKRALDLAKSRGNAAASTATPTPIATSVASAASTGVAGGGAADATKPKGDGGSEYGVWGGIPGSATYEQQVKAIVFGNFRPMEHDASLTCDLRIFVEFNGKISHTENESPSANPSFCAAAEVALKESDPLPPPPLETKLYLSHQGLLLRFHATTQAQAAQP